MKEITKIPDNVENREPESIKNEYEWALQYFHGRQYVKALDKFDYILNSGQYLAHAEEMPYYMGMCLYHLGRYQEAIEFFRTYANRQPRGSRAQRARFVMLETMKNARMWAKIPTLANEAYKLSTYPTDQIIIKLNLAEALAETGEYVGSRQEIDLVDRKLSIIPKGNFVPNEDGIDKENLHDRSFYVRTVVRMRECQSAPAPKIAETATRIAMLGKWFENQGRCLTKIFAQTTPKFALLNPRWLAEITHVLLDGVDRLDAYPGQLVRHSKVRDLRESLDIGKKHIQDTYYSIATLLENSIKLNEFRPLVKSAEEQLLSRVQSHSHNITISSSQR